MLDITTDTVPVVLVLIYQPQGTPVISSGSAAALEYEEAIRKAFTEAELMAITWAKRKDFLRTPEAVRTVEDHARFYNSRAHVRYVEWMLEAQTARLPSARTFEQGIVHAVNPVLVDITPKQPQTGLTVVRAIAPELMTMNFGHATDPYGHNRLEMLGLQWMRGFPAIPHFLA